VKRFTDRETRSQTYRKQFYRSRQPVSSESEIEVAPSRSRRRTDDLPRAATPDRCLIADISCTHDIPGGVMAS